MYRVYWYLPFPLKALLYGGTCISFGHAGASLKRSTVSTVLPRRVTGSAGGTVRMPSQR